MRKELKVNPMWFVLLVTFIAGCITIYAETGDISAVVWFAVIVGVFFAAAAIVLFTIAFTFAVVFVGGIFLWQCCRRRVSAT